MTTWDEQPRADETPKQWLARLINEGCPATEWCRIADAHKASTEAAPLNQPGPTEPDTRKEPS